MENRQQGPSVSAETRQGGLTQLVSNRKASVLPSRERVTAAIALVRARQAVTSSQPSFKVVKNDVESLRKPRNSTREKSIPPTVSMTSTLTSGTSLRKETTAAEPKIKLSPSSASANEKGRVQTRSPLTPVEQSQSFFPPETKASRTPQGVSSSGSFFQNLFASRSDAMASPANNHHQQSQNVPLTNIHSFASTLTTKPESQGVGASQISQSSVARDRAASASTQNDSVSTEPSAVPVHKVSSFDTDSEVAAVDEKTMQDVSKFLDALKLKGAGASTPAGPAALQATKGGKLSTFDEEDPIEALRQISTEEINYDSEDSDDSDDSDDSSEGEFNQETLAEIGAFIDAVAQRPAGSDKAPVVIPLIADLDSDEDDSTTVEKVPDETRQNILSILDRLEQKKTNSEEADPEAADDGNLSTGETEGNKQDEKEEALSRSILTAAGTADEPIILDEPNSGEKMSVQAGTADEPIVLDEVPTDEEQPIDAEEEEVVFSMDKSTEEIDPTHSEEPTEASSGTAGEEHPADGEQSSFEGSMAVRELVRHDAPTFADPTLTAKVVDETTEEHADVSPVSSTDTASRVIEQTKTTKPSPIYEQMAVVEKGAGADPPAVNPYEGPRRADPPGPKDWSEAVMRMYEADVAPSYSAESLESGPTIRIDADATGIEANVDIVASVEEEKKEEEPSEDEPVEEVEEDPMEIYMGIKGVKDNASPSDEADDDGISEDEEDMDAMEITLSASEDMRALDAATGLVRALHYGPEPSKSGDAFDSIEDSLNKTIRNMVDEELNKTIRGLVEEKDSDSEVVEYGDELERVTYSGGDKYDNVEDMPHIEELCKVLSPVMEGGSVDTDDNLDLGVGAKEKDSVDYEELFLEALGSSGEDTAPSQPRGLLGEAFPQSRSSDSERNDSDLQASTDDSSKMEQTQEEAAVAAAAAAAMAAAMGIADEHTGPVFSGAESSDSSSALQNESRMVSTSASSGEETDYDSQLAYTSADSSEAEMMARERSNRSGAAQEGGHRGEEQPYESMRIATSSSSDGGDLGGERYACIEELDGVKSPTAEAATSSAQHGNEVTATAATAADVFGEDVVNSIVASTSEEESNARGAQAKSSSDDEPSEDESVVESGGSTEDVAATKSEETDALNESIEVAQSGENIRIDGLIGFFRSGGVAESVADEEDKDSTSSRQSGAVTVDSRSKALEALNLPGPPSGDQSTNALPTVDEETQSVPWELRDIASEETMKAAGRTKPRPFFGARVTKSKQARVIKSLLSDDSSAIQSQAMDSQAAGSQALDRIESGEQLDGSSASPESAPAADQSNINNSVDEKQSNGTNVDALEDIQYLPNIPGPSLVPAPSLAGEEKEEDQTDGEEEMEDEQEDAESEDAESEDAGEDPSGRLCRTVEKQEEPKPDPDGVADNESAYSENSDDVVDEAIYEVAEEFEVEADDFAATVHGEIDESEAESEEEAETESESESDKFHGNAGTGTKSEETSGDEEEESGSVNMEKADRDINFVDAFLQAGSSGSTTSGSIDGHSPDAVEVTYSGDTQRFDEIYDAIMKSSGDDGEEEENNEEEQEVEQEEKTETAVGDDEDEEQEEEEEEYEDGLANNVGSFLEQFEALEVAEEEPEPPSEAARTSDAFDVPPPPPANPTAPDFRSPGAMARYFATLDHGVEDEDLRMRIGHFQKLMVPVISGNKPSIIETAQIRQAAIKSNVDLDVVDRFLDYVEGDADVVAAQSSEDEGNQMASRWDDMEDLDEDDAIAAFLTRFGELKSGGHFEKANLEAIGEYANAPKESSDEEAVEVDAVFGYVKKDLEPKEDEDEDEWWNVSRPGDNERPVAAIRRVDDSDDEEDDIPDVQEQQEQEQHRQVSTDKESGDADDENEVVDNDDENEDAFDSDEMAKSRSAPRGLVVDTSGAAFPSSQLSPAGIAAATPKKSGSGFPRQTSQDVYGTTAPPPLVMPTTTFGYDREHDKGSWLSKKAMASHGKSGWEKHSSWLSPRSSASLVKPRPINGVGAADNLRKFPFCKRLFPGSQPWKLSYKERTKNHSGYFSIDLYSLSESSMVGVAAFDKQDMAPWEHRAVKQQFLHERSIAYSRNWFGQLVRKRANRKHRAPICQPKSMEMPIENIPDPGEWTAEWYTTWKSPLEKRREAYDDRSTASSSGSESSEDDGDSYTDRGSYASRSHNDNDNSTINQKSVASRDSTYSGSSSGHDSDDDLSWEEAPECGTIVNLKLKIGERVSRVHPDYTSSLRRSRWRKKHFPRGTFPY